jgi:hypothetical protein
VIADGLRLAAALAHHTILKPNNNANTAAKIAGSRISDFTFHQKCTTPAAPLM